MFKNAGGGDGLFSKFSAPPPVLLGDECKSI